MKELTALHEAAHVVIAYLSSYHFLQGDITLTSDTTGLTFVTLNRKKILAMDKEPIAAISSDPDVVEDAAIIFYAGLEAERIFCREHNIALDESHSANDYNHVDELVEQSTPALEVDKDSIVAFSKRAVLANWEPIKAVAELLLTSKNSTISAVEAIELLDMGFNQNSFS